MSTSPVHGSWQKDILLAKMRCKNLCNNLAFEEMLVVAEADRLLQQERCHCRAD